MTPYQLKDGQRIHDLDTDDLIKRVNVMWAKLEITGRVRMVQYVRVPFMTEYEYTCEPPPAPIQGCALPPYMLDNITALTEILNTRPSDRQASRDLYVYELGYAIQEAVAA